MATKPLTELPVPHGKLVGHIASHPSTPIATLIQSYRQYEAHLREAFA